MKCERCGGRKAKNKTCKFCKRLNQQRYQRTVNGFLIHKYSHFNTRNGQTKGRIKVGMTKEEFIRWSRKSLKFLLLYAQWRQKNFHSWFVPSVDRIRDDGHYDLLNSQWVTWRENFDKEQEKYFVEPEGENQEPEPINEEEIDWF